MTDRPGTAYSVTAPQTTAGAARRNSRVRLINLLVEAERGALMARSAYEVSTPGREGEAQRRLWWANAYAAGVMDALKALDG